MNITEVRVKLVGNRQDKLRGYASITVDDCIVIRDLKIIEGHSGLFVAMPSRKIHDRCPGCSHKNPIRARHCNDCGAELDKDRAETDDRGRTKLYADIAHPIHQEGRDEVQRRVVLAYHEEARRDRAGERGGAGFVDIDYDRPLRGRSGR